MVSALEVMQAYVESMGQVANDIVLGEKLRIVLVVGSHKTAGGIVDYWDVADLVV